MAGRASLSFLGQEDISLSGDPQVTYFIERYAGQTLFSQRVDQVIFDEQAVFFGGENHRILPKSGDLITNMYLYIQFPALPTNYGVLDSVGTLMFQYVELYLGTELIERLYAEHIEMKYDLEVPKGKQPGLSYLIGKNLQFSTIPQAAYTIPLPFSTFKKGLVVDGADITFRIVWNPSTFFTTPAYTIPGTITSHLNVEYTYLSEPEKKNMKTDGYSGDAGIPRLQIFEQVQRMEFFAPHGVSNVQCLLDFYNPVKELFVVLQNDSALGYDYSNTATSASTTIGTTDLLNNLELDFNGVSRIEPRVGTPQFLRIIQPLEFHTRVPSRLFYMYSFSLDPEGDTPCGSVNLTRIQNQKLYISLAPTPANVRIRIYATSYNFLEGPKVVFSNFK
jgi:Large eukaryotic DNA virus major capsid protein/Major capsid protein N-terminus